MRGSMDRKARSRAASSKQAEGHVVAHNIVSAIFLAIVASIPTLISSLTGVSTGFGGTSLIIAIGVALDTQRAIETQLVMRNYSGFLK